MEVHHHSHAHNSKKKWTHYFWEFLMLFLAVYCGFLAENLREHQVEHRREKEYIRSLLDDLKDDTTEINKSKRAAAVSLAYEDSLMYYLYKNPPEKFLPQHFLDLDLKAMLRLKIIFNESTAQQLKNSGNMRLIRNPDVFRRIALYWNEQEYTRITLTRYLEYRNRGREYAEKLFAYSDQDLVDAGLIPLSSKGVRVIQSSPVYWAEYSNIISHCHITVSNYRDQLEKLLNTSKKLILVLQKEYHLK
ncbi:MAG TPA: hypothetical protein PKC72_01580 [Chitinophagaceae bacterium]|nr:hypothetical protein [Chitinophagaceae bacterium]